MRNPRDYTTDNGAFIASARRQCLLVLGMGALCIQLTWSELDRQESYNTFAYVEKAIAVVSTLLDTGKVSVGGQKDLFETLNVPKQQSRMLHHVTEMVGSSSVLEIEIIDKSGLKTRGDPTNSCSVRAFKLDPPRAKEIYHQDLVVIEIIVVSSMAEESLLTFAQPWSTTLVTFPAICYDRLEITDPFFVLKYGDEEKVGLVFPTRVLYGLGKQRKTRASLEGLEPILGGSWVVVKPEQAKRLSGFEHEFFRALDYAVVEGIVLDYAELMSNRTYRNEELDEAIGSILRSTVESGQVWGIKIHAAATAVIMPFLFLSLSMGILYRVVRINPHGELTSTPWVIVNPHGILEFVGANGFALLLLGSIGASEACVWVFETESWDAIRRAWHIVFVPRTEEYSDMTPLRFRLGHALEATLLSWLFWCTVTNVGAVALMSRAIIRIWCLGSLSQVRGRMWNLDRLRDRVERVGVKVLLWWGSWSRRQ